MCVKSSPPGGVHTRVMCVCAGARAVCASQSQSRGLRLRLGLLSACVAAAQGATSAGVVVACDVLHGVGVAFTLRCPISVKRMFLRACLGCAPEHWARG